MSTNHTYTQIAADYALWAEFVDPNAAMSEAEFNDLSVEQKVTMQVEAFGPEQSREADE